MKLGTKCRRILVIDDNLHMADCIVQMAETLDIECHTSHDLEDAYEKLCANNYGLLLLDTHVNKKSGIEFVKFVRSRWPMIKIAVVSTRNSDMTRNLVANSSTDFYLPKPLKTSDIADILISI
jgi:DNA-binding response OmpR family regulator